MNTKNWISLLAFVSGAYLFFDKPIHGLFTWAVLFLLANAFYGKE